MSKIKLPSVRDLDVAGKRVIVRVDFNEPIEKGRVTDDFKIGAALPTLQFLLRKRARLFLISHRSDTRGSLKPIVVVLKRFLRREVGFITNPSISAQERDKLFSKYDILLLENVRRFKGEQENSKSFAKVLSHWGDVYLNEAFAVSHRHEASLVELPRLLPHAAGLRFLEEVKMLSVDFKKKKPLLFILGGNKFATKVALIDTFLRVADTLFIAGAIGNTFLAAQGAEVGKSKIEREYVARIKEKYRLSKKIKLPIDYIEEENIIYDIGLKTLDMVEREIKKSKFIIWNGPVGFCEKGFGNGTKKIAQMILKYKKSAIVGGGDTVAALRVWNLHNKFSVRGGFTSTAGGAMIDFLANGTLPGIEALKH